MDVVELRPSWPQAVIADYKANLISYFTLCEKFSAQYGAVLTAIHENGYGHPKEVPSGDLMRILIESEGVVGVFIGNN